MTNPPGPEVPGPPAYEPPPAAAAPPAYPAPTYSSPGGYAAAPPAPVYGTVPNAPIPGRTLGIVALIVAFFANIIGLILGIVALVQSRKAGHKNLPAVWAIIVGAILFVVGVILAIVLIGIAIAAGTEFARLCAEYGSGVHEINGAAVTLTCS